MTPSKIETAPPPERKRLALFLDGTWNTLDDNTNVWRLKALCAQRATDGVRQVAYYSRGVGTTATEKLRGGVLGVGLERNVSRAYEWLVETFEPGDEIFIFGFSRGAYTARSLAGFIALCGLLKPGAPLGTGQLFDRYRRGDERRTIRWLRNHDRDGTLIDATREERWMVSYAMPVQIKMVGVWDTVGSLGVQTTRIPGLDKIPGLSRSGYAFLHTGLRLPIENGYHALAIDERRASFAPTLWTKKFRDGVPLSEIAPPRDVANVEQRWFVGAHANVGGGYRDDLLSQLPLHWIMEKAAGHGLAFRADVILETGVLDVHPRDSYGAFGYGLYHHVSKPFDRMIGAPPQSANGERDEVVNETIDASVFERWRTDPSYRPPNLLEWGRRHGVEPGALTDAVFAHDLKTVVPVTPEAEAHGPSE
ncbi:DUF2235 domain-containing protein [Methylobacterium sp. E-016]|uniref:DUF2235 domain-containing protein n=1 Tax=Methylobacterium sp. E-016 TaxID=2836556 RepID=UPI001FB86CAB|nr:DUF2235 domain-containing protein [Methylobacterium sp. E-016]MCJ2075540.1 DUF2235 domain-containing protein [Methylobacterium sp. E-016]